MLGSSSARLAPWEQLGDSSTLTDSLSRQFHRLRKKGFQMPWACGACNADNSTWFGSCEACRSENERYSSAIAADDEPDLSSHVLLIIARRRGSKEVEACFELCAAVAWEGTDLDESCCHYRRAFKLWHELDSDLDLHGVPLKLREEADAILLDLHGDNEKSCLTSHAELEEAPCILHWLVEEAEEDLALAAFLGKPDFKIKTVFREDKAPNIVVTAEGTVLTTYGLTTLKARRSLDGGATWGEIIPIASGIHSGGTIVDESTGCILVFVEEQHPPAALHVYRSTDDGLTWDEIDIFITPDTHGHVPSMHMNEHGITLQCDKYRGRLLRASRWYAGGDDMFEFPRHFTNAVYSDDHGASWHTSEPFPAMGTGEAAVVERSDGTIYYNTRRHWSPSGKSLQRWSATSADGGATWTDLQRVADLPDGPQGDGFGLFGGLVRLPLDGRDLLIFSNCDSAEERMNGTVWFSRDGGRTWPLKRVLFKRNFAYSSLAVGRAGTSSEGWIYCFFEGPMSSGQVVRFNLAWLLDGEANTKS